MRWFGARKKATEGGLRFASTSETVKREREVTLLVNLIEPDIRYQPMFVSDEAGPLDICNLDERGIQDRLRSYLPEVGGIDVHVPLWRLVDELKRRYPGWPDERPWE